MMIIPRSIEKILLETIQTFPSLTITGPRQSGKTTLVKRLFPEATYFSMENPDIRRMAMNDPRGFLQDEHKIVILDEIQNTPELLSYLQEIMDIKQQKYILTGSNNFTLLESVNQSLAGRTATFTLLPFSFNELQMTGADYHIDELLFNGSYPAVYDQKRDPTVNFRSYYNTYLERDVRKLINIKDIHSYEKFIRICAGRIGQVLNINSISNEIGVSANTIKAWLSTLEASYIIFLLQPFHKNIGKRLIKSPKLYFYDTGLASYLLGIETKGQLSRDPLYGALFENYCISEILKKRFNRGLSSNLFFYRDSNMNEIDLVQKEGSTYRLIEIKSSSTFHTNFLKGLDYFEKNVDSSVFEKICLYKGPDMPSLFNCKILNLLSYFGD